MNPDFLDRLSGRYKQAMNYRVLVIDDDHGIRQMLRMALSTEDWDVVLATDGEKGLSLFDQQEFDLIICDVMMPRMSGAEVLRRIREISTSVPVIVMTGDSFRDPSIDLSSLRDVQDEFEPTLQIEKPFRPSELIRVAASLLGRRGIASPVDID
jgi:DNA-binding response OmpR family regulator